MRASSHARRRILSRQNSAERKATADTLSDHHNVRRDPCPFMRKQLTGPANAALDFIEHHQDTVLITQITQPLKASIRQDFDPTLAQYPLACAVGGAVMDIVADDAFLAEVNRKASLMRQKLEGLVATHPDVFESVRGTGLMLGLKCVAVNMDVVNAGYDHNLLVVPAADNVIRLLPALNIPDTDIAAAVEKLDAAATQVARNA
jgi:hypothetical protein